MSCTYDNGANYVLYGKFLYSCLKKLKYGITLELYKVLFYYTIVAATVLF